MDKHFVFSIFLLIGTNLYGQLSWPSSNWDVATNLTSIMSSNGVESLSGVHFNSSKNQLFLAQDIGRLRVIQLNANGNHLQLTDRNLGGDLEGITQVNEDDNEFWVVDENNLVIKKYGYNNNFSQVNLENSWDLTLAQSGMEHSDQGGPEGICFIPDQALGEANFVSSLTGLPYQSQKGMGGLIFIAHQVEGEIWVYDINKNLNNDFVLVGTYRTNRIESCGLEFDRSTGLLYILHNLQNNFMEVTDLSTNFVNGHYQLNTTYEFNVTVPTNGGKNIEGIALAPKCQDEIAQRLWLTRDGVDTNIDQALKQFSPISLVGDCSTSASIPLDQVAEFLIYPNPAEENLVIVKPTAEKVTYAILDSSGRKVVERTLQLTHENIDVSQLDSGIYTLIIGTRVFKFQKQ